MRVKSCVVIGCESNFDTDGRETRRFRFPKDEVRCKLWVERCRNKNLLSLNADTLYGIKRICGKHFAPHAFVNALKQRLVHDAVPSIFQFNLEESDLPKEPMVWCPKKRVIMPDIQKTGGANLPIPLPQPRRVLLPNGPQGNNPKLEIRVPNHASSKPISLKDNDNDHQNDSLVEESIVPPNITSRVLNELPRGPPKQTESSNLQHPSVSEEPNRLLLPPSGSQHETTSLLDLEPNIWEKHMELFQQSEGKEFLIVGEVCMIAEKDPNQMCGSVKCNDDLYSSKRAEQLVRCWSRCKKWFHLRCTDLTPEEYTVLSNKESLRWLCEECCKDDIF